MLGRLAIPFSDTITKNPICAIDIKEAGLNEAGHLGFVAPSYVHRIHRLMQEDIYGKH